MSFFFVQSLTILLHVGVTCTGSVRPDSLGYSYSQYKDTHNWSNVSGIVDSLRNCGMDEWGYVSKLPTDCTPSGILTPDTWGTTYRACSGANQSPVKLRFLQSVYKKMDPMHFFNYDYEMGLDIEIIGTNLVLFPNASRLAVFGGPLKVEYTFVMAVLHFGTSESNGAEHDIDSEAYAAELQLIHYTETNIGINCFRGANGLLALVILFKQAANNNTDLDDFMTAVAELAKDGSKGTTRQSFYLSAFMPASTINFYLYSGSLSFPPCTERLINVVFQRSVEIGRAQLEVLRSLKGRLKNVQCKVPLAGNTRKPSESGGASSLSIYRSFRFVPSRQAARTAVANTLIVLGHACVATLTTLFVET